MKAAVPDSARTIHLLACWTWSGGVAETTSACASRDGAWAQSDEAATSAMCAERGGGTLSGRSA